jgi:hypothetical protein
MTVSAIFLGGTLREWIESPCVLAPFNGAWHEDTASQPERASVTFGGSPPAPGQPASSLPGSNVPSSSSISASAAARLEW